LDFEIIETDDAFRIFESWWFTIKRGRASQSRQWRKFYSQKQEIAWGGEKKFLTETFSA